jgi:hypothetical protein
MASARACLDSISLVIALLFLLHPPGAYPGKALDLAAQASKKKAHWSLFDSKKVGAFTQKAVQSFQTGACKKYQFT